MNFGIPKQKVTKKQKELFPDKPVLTITGLGKDELGQPSKKSRPMVLNTKAVEVLKLNDNAKIAFSFDNGIHILNGENEFIPEEHKLRVTKNYPRKINDKKTVTYISKVKNLDNTVDNHFKLVSSESESNKEFNFLLWELVLFNPKKEANETPNQTSEEHDKELNKDLSSDTYYKPNDNITFSDEKSDNTFDNTSSFSEEIDLD